ncbi:hypothetical protein KUTeg_010049 [Tegillarca granosa]|uniref:Uncharacterized protein n=1 Tax=Tegillarca granosa TaxID=220873 RepID=A0ABQ9F7X3_TEGGR|nr:hypothetical protein KUTeg_010049 [Tegillarca granosa]
MSKIYLYAPSAGLYSCPIAMTDGAAKIIEGFASVVPWLKDHAFTHLLSRQPSDFWTSGQWMTERRGGSDVANGTETLAVLQTDGSYKLFGYKWFSSATDADITFTLARIVDDRGHTIKGTKGLTLFYLETRKENGELNNIYIQKLKNKLGTKQVPTAELLLDGPVAFKVSEEGRGVAGISSMLTISRIHNAMSAVGAMRRFVEVRGATLLTLEIARLLGREDTGIATEEEKLLIRLLTPLAKLYTGKQAMSVVSEGVECFGGQGYIEDTGIPGLLRDAQVLTIWEGTTNVLSLDVLRAVAKTKGQVLAALKNDVQQKLSKADNGDLLSCANKINEAVMSLLTLTMKHQDKMETAARDFAFNLSQVYIGISVFRCQIVGNLFSSRCSAC